MAASDYIPEGFQLLPGTADVDRLCIDGCPIELLAFLISGDVDLAAGLHFSSTSDNLAAMGSLIISGPQVVFVRNFRDRREFHRELQGQDPFRYLPLSSNPNKFLDAPNPRRIRAEMVLDALVTANIDIVNFLSFGMKSNLDLFQFLDHFVPLPPGSSIQMDIGWAAFQAVGNKVPVVGLSGDYEAPRRGRTLVYPMYPMFSHISTEAGKTFGSFKWTTDFGGDV